MFKQTFELFKCLGTILVLLVEKQINQLIVLRTDTKKDVIVEILLNSRYKQVCLTRS